MQRLIPQPPRYKLLWLIALVLGAGLYFRLVNLDKKVYWHDEVYTSLLIAGYDAAEIRTEVLTGRPVPAEELWKYEHLNPEKSVVDTISILAVKYPEHPPLYFVIARLWAQLFGDSTCVIRSLSAVISLFIFPCLYWLCRELFDSSLTAWIAMALMAVSPFHVLYAQEARQYTLLTVVILFSSAALLHAMRRQTKRIWIVYAVSLPLGLYTHLLFSMVIVAHGIYVLGVDSKSLNPRRFKLSQTATRYLLSILVACGAFAPWFITARRHFPSGNSAWWFSNAIGVSKLMKRWLFGFGSVFLDTAGPNIRAIYGINHRSIDLAHLPVLILQLYAIYFLYRHTERRTWLLVVALTGTTFLSLALPDVLWGGQRSGVPRYMTASYLGVQLAVAHLFARQITAITVRRRRNWLAFLCVLIFIGIVSCAISSQANVWWNKGDSSYNPRAARVINASRDPLVISDFSGYGFANTLSLSRLLRSDVRLQLLADADAPIIVSPASDVFIFGSAETTRRRIESEGRYRLDPVTEPTLWRLVQK